MERFQANKCISVSPFGEICQLIADEPVEFEKYLVEVQDFRKLPIFSEESTEHASNEYESKAGRCQHVTGWIQNLDQLYMPTNFPGTLIGMYNYDSGEKGERRW